MRSKIVILLIVFLIIVSIFLLSFFHHDNPLMIGEEKYLEFLWMVDGAFNNERYQESFKVNGREISKESKSFYCAYKDNNNTCLGYNFEKSFANLFASNITYDMVYSDEKTFSWYKMIDNNYYFTNLTSCSIDRMSLNQTMKVMDVTNKKMTYVISYHEGINEYERKFVLIKEDRKWKISEAYYHDLCHMDYYIS